MITEIQLANNRLHFMYLQRVVGEIAGSTGMSRQDGEDMWKAIHHVCVTSLNSVKETADGKVSILLAADESSFTAEVVDRYNVFNAVDDNGYSREMQNAGRLVDSIELLRGADETTIRLTKASDRNDQHSISTAPIPVMGVGLGRS